MPSHRIALLILLAFVIPVLACNAPFMQSSSPTATSVPTLVAAAGGALPQVVIESPSSGTQAVIQQPLTVRVHATDSVGITRVDMQESGRIVVSQPSPDPNPDLTALLVYRPSTLGTVTLEVVAYRNTVASPAVTMTVEVVASAAQLKNPGLLQPTSGVALGAYCTAHPTVSGLSLRAGPGTNYRILGVGKVGEDLNVIGRNSDSSWYNITRGTTLTGWVSAPFTSLDGDCSKAPVTTPTP